MEPSKGPHNTVPPKASSRAAQESRKFQRPLYEPSLARREQDGEGLVLVPGRTAEQSAPRGGQENMGTRDGAWALSFFQDAFSLFWVPAPQLCSQLQVPTAPGAHCKGTFLALEHKGCGAEEQPASRALTGHVAQSLGPRPVGTAPSRLPGAPPCRNAERARSSSCAQLPAQLALRLCMQRCPRC